MKMSKRRRFHPFRLIIDRSVNILESRFRLQQLNLENISEKQKQKKNVKNFLAEGKRKWMSLSFEMRLTENLEMLVGSFQCVAGTD